MLTEKTIRKSYPQKGVIVQLVEKYSKNFCPRRLWKLWVKYKDDRSLEIHGILTDKQEALQFYTLVRRSLIHNRK